MRTEEVSEGTRNDLNGQKAGKAALGQVPTLLSASDIPLLAEAGSSRVWLEVALLLRQSTAVMMMMMTVTTAGGCQHGSDDPQVVGWVLHHGRRVEEGEACDQEPGKQKQP